MRGYSKREGEKKKARIFFLTIEGSMVDEEKSLTRERVFEDAGNGSNEFVEFSNFRAVSRLVCEHFFS